MSLKEKFFSRTGIESGGNSSRSDIVFDSRMNVQNKLNDCVWRLGLRCCADPYVDKVCRNIREKCNQTI